MLNIVWRRAEIEIQGRMGRRPARVKASTRLSVKPLDAANGMMDRLTDNVVNNVELFWGEVFLIFSPQCWSAVGNEACGSGEETSPPSSPSPTGPTGEERKILHSSKLPCLSQSQEKHTISVVNDRLHPSSKIKYRVVFLTPPLPPP